MSERIRLTPKVAARLEAAATDSGVAASQLANVAIWQWLGQTGPPPEPPPWAKLAHDPPAEGLKPATSGQFGPNPPVGGVGGGAFSLNPEPAQEEEKARAKTQGGSGGGVGQFGPKRQKRQRFVPPTVAEVEAYCRERKNRVNATTFVNFYASKGWMVGKNKMKDWQAAVHTWEQNDGGSGKTGGASQGQGRPGRHHREGEDWDACAITIDADGDPGVDGGAGSDAAT